MIEGGPKLTLLNDNNKKYATKLDEQLAKMSGPSLAAQQNTAQNDFYQNGVSYNEKPIQNGYPDMYSQKPVSSYSSNGPIQNGGIQRTPSYNGMSATPYSPTSPNAYHPVPFSPTSSNAPPGAPDGYNYGNYGDRSPVISRVLSPVSPGAPPHFSAHTQNIMPAPPPPPPPEPISSSKIMQSPSVPDAVLNMAAKGAPDKKPYSYIPDAQAILSQRDKVRKRPSANIPSYQKVLNFPSFSENQHNVQYSPTSPPSAYPPNQAENEGFVAHSQFNSPLNLYTDDNLKDAFKGQSGDTVNVERLSGKKQDSDITQSPVYKMIHGLDNTERRAPSSLSERSPSATPSEVSYNRPLSRQTSKEPREQQRNFNGNMRESDIPSKSFQRLQSWTDNLEDPAQFIRSPTPLSRAPSRQASREESYANFTPLRKDSDIPSRAFQRLQKWTNNSSIGDEVAGNTRKISQPEAPVEEYSDMRKDEGIDISYVGSSIPSRSFKMLQQSIGESGNKDADIQTSSPQSTMRQLSNGSVGPQSTMRQLSNGSVGGSDIEGTHQSAMPVGRQRRRRIPSSQRSVSSGGRLNAHTSNQAPEEPPKNQAPFDEDAYLSGRVPIVRGTDEPPKQPFKEIVRNDPNAREEEDKKQERVFDESAYLKGQVSLYGDQPIKTNPELKPKGTKEEIKPPAWLTKRRSVVLTTEDGVLDEGAFIQRINSIEDGEEKPDWLDKVNQRKPIEVDLANKASTVSDEKPAWADTLPRAEDFDESKIFANRKVEEVKPEWQDKVKTNQFDESKIMMAKVKQEMEENAAEWQKRTEGRQFDEAAMLAARSEKDVDEDAAEWQRRTAERKFDEAAIRAAKLEKETKPEVPEALKRHGQLTGKFFDQFDVNSPERNLKSPSGENVEIPDWAKQRQSAKVIDDPLHLKNNNKVENGDIPDWAKRRQSVTKEMVDPLLKQRDTEKTGENVEWVAKVQNRRRPSEIEPYDESNFLGIQKSLEDCRAGDLSAEEQEKEKIYDERMFLAGRIPLVKGGEPDLTPLPRPPKSRARQVKKEAKPKLDQPFDENAFLAGRVNILGGSTEQLNKPARVPRQKNFNPKAPWQKKDEELLTDDEYDENKFLRGNINVLRQSVDREALPPRPASAQAFERPQNRQFRQRAPWEREQESETSDSEYDENSFLRRSVTPSGVRSGSTEAQQRDVRKVRSKSHMRLSRSISSSETEGRAQMIRRSKSMDRAEDSEGEIPYSEMKYTGNKIPSKTFIRLRKSVDAGSRQNDPTVTLRRQKSRDDELMDVDDALEKIKIGENSTNYLETLRQTCESNALKMEQTEDITDF